VAVATIAAGFVGLLSLFNIGGRFFWASLSDHIGRKATYYTFFILGIALYASAPSFAHMGSRLLFVGAFCAILTMYGGGFATIPAYLADIFGPQFVGAIHGRLLTAWSTAGVVGPLLVGYIRDVQLQAGMNRALVYDRTMYILAGLLVIGLICNLLIRPVNPKWHLSHEEAARLQAESANREAAIQHGSFGIGKGGLDVSAALFWLFVGIPLAWGVYKTLESAIKIF
jgi:MFS family permease